jgi:hypothetical protein
MAGKRDPERNKAADAVFGETFMPYAIGGGLLAAPTAIGALGLFPADGFAPFLLVIACAVLVVGIMMGNQAVKRFESGRE